jgi:hypothetical protein
VYLTCKIYDWIRRHGLAPFMLKNSLFSHSMFESCILLNLSSLGLNRACLEWWKAHWLVGQSILGSIAVVKFGMLCFTSYIFFDK